LYRRKEKDVTTCNNLGEFLRINRRPPCRGHFGIGVAHQSIQAEGMECVKFLSQGRLSKKKWRIEGINEWSGNELCSNMMDSRNIISSSKKVRESKEIHEPENHHPFSPVCHTSYIYSFFFPPRQTKLINHGILNPLRLHRA